jgi:hypothetical protein
VSIGPAPTTSPVWWTRPEGWAPQVHRLQLVAVLLRRLGLPRSQGQQRLLQGLEVMPITEHATDTHGATLINFGPSKLPIAV